jgi:cell division protein FtsN
LQAGAFKTRSNAERLAARLAAAGVVARIESSTLDDGSTVHRVVAGPFTSTEAAKTAADQIAGLR